MIGPQQQTGTRTHQHHRRTTRDEEQQSAPTVESPSGTSTFPQPTPRPLAAPACWPLVIPER